MTQSEEQIQDEVPQGTGLALGIDFGNSHISAAVWRPDKKTADMVKFGDKSSFPATLYFRGLGEKPQRSLEDQNEQESENENNPEEDDGYKPVIGVEYSSKKNMDYFVYDIKKYMGKRLLLDDIKGNITYKLTQDENGNIFCFNEKMTFETMAKFLFEKVVEAAKEQFKDEINFCTISVPHGFNNDQRTSVISAANAAGIKNVFIINDPLSTSIYYISKNKLLNSECFLIIDFGSSKLDLSLVTISKNNSIKIKIAGGEEGLGGGNLDMELFKEVKENYKNEGGSNLNDQQKLNLLKLVEKAKIKLTFENEATIDEKKFDGKKDLHSEIKRERFDELNREIYSNIIKLINKLIKEAKIKKSDINHIFLQGNSIRVVKLKEMISQEFPDIDMFEFYNSIPMGAAIYTAKKINLMKNVQFNNFKIYDITPLSLGIRAEGDLMSVILPRGTKVPIKAEKYFITTQDNQSSIKLEIYTGERKLIKDNILLCKIMLKNIQPGNKGEVHIQVTFEVDENFLLTVTAREMDTENDNYKQIQVYVNESLSQTEILEKVEDSKKNEKQDLDEKSRIQAMLRLNDKIFEYSHLYEGNEDILRELESYRNWIKHSTTVPKEEYEQKLKELNDNMQDDKRLMNKNKTNTKNSNRVKIEEEKN
jgi:molecular chaperone DnaK (HSP70)